MKKIIQINVTCGRGSTGKLAQSLYEGAEKAGYRSLFAFGDFTPTIPTAFSIETNLQRTARKACNRLFGRKQKHSVPGTRRLIRYMEKEKPDLVHLHNIHHNVTNYNMLFAYLKQKQIPTVFTLHDCWAFTGGCYHFTSRNCEGYKTGCDRCDLPAQRDDVSHSMGQGYRWRKELLGDFAGMYPICVSNWLRDRARESYMGQMKNIPQTIYNGINTDLFCPKQSNIRADLGIGENAFVILGIASFWTEEKGLSVFRNLRAALPQDAVVVLVGQGSEQMQGPGVICIPGTENQEQLAQLYSAADVYINASMEETFGMTTAEALACGTPAVVFDSTACPEVVDGHTGIVIKNDAELLDAVQTIKEQGKQAYTQNCVARARALFDEKCMVAEYLALYRRILDGE